MRRVWTAEEDRVLVSGAGAFALAYFIKRVGPSHTFHRAPQRSRYAIYARARRLWGPGGFTRGVFTFNALARESGYGVDALRRAQKALNHSYKRLTPRGAYLISYDQREDLYAWLAHDFWCKSLRRYNCAWCAQSSRSHKGAGLCTRCYCTYHRLCRRLNLPTSPQQLRHSPRISSRLREHIAARMERGVAPPREELRGLESAKDG